MKTKMPPSEGPFFVDGKEQKKNSLNIQKWELDRFPKVITIFTRHFKMFIKLFFDQWIILNGYCIPHKVLMKKGLV